MGKGNAHKGVWQGVRIILNKHSYILPSHTKSASSRGPDVQPMQVAHALMAVCLGTVGIGPVWKALVDGDIVLLLWLFM